MSERLVNDPDGEVLVSYLSALADDVILEAGIEDAVYFLTHVDVFLPVQGHPPNDGLRSAVFWLMVNYVAHHSDRMGVGVGFDDGGTQKTNSKLVVWLDAQLKAAGIVNGPSPYLVSAIATAAREVKKSDAWAKAMDQVT